MIEDNGYAERSSPIGGDDASSVEDEGVLATAATQTVAAEEDTFEDELATRHMSGGTRPGGYESVANTGSEHSPTTVRFLSTLTIVLGAAVVLLLGYIHWRDSSPLPNVGPQPSSIQDAENLEGNSSNKLELAWKPLPDPSTTLTKIAFGSCMSQHMPMPHWDTILEYDPNMLVLMGDNVYGDCHDDSCEVLEQAYQDFVDHPSVQGSAPRISVFATLDDHDYGQGDCHADNPHKDYARQLFQQVFQPGNLPDDGVYRARAWGPPGQRVQIILLDTRYSRSPFLQMKNGRYYPVPLNDTSTPQQVLSEKQWAWLEEQLQQPADLRFIVSSVQVLNDGTDFECWRHLPRERERFYNLLRQHNPSSIVLLTGDRHMGGFYETQDGSLREVTASSFTHSFPLAAIHEDCTPETCDEEDPRRIGPLVHENHWGSIEIDWLTKNVTIALRRSDSSPGVSYLQHLKGKGTDAGKTLQSRVYSF